MAQLIRTTPMLAEHQLLLVFMDCFGKRQDVYLSLSGGPSLADKSAATLAEMTTTEQTITENAKTYGIDLTQALADGAAAIAAALADASDPDTTQAAG